MSQKAVWASVLCDLLTFYIWIFSSDNAWLNEPKLGRKHSSIYGRSSFRFSHFILIGQKTLSPWEILVSGWLKFKNLLLRDTMNCRNDVYEVLSKISIFCADRATNMAAIDSSCLWLSLRDRGEGYSNSSRPSVCPSVTLSCLRDNFSKHG